MKKLKPWQKICPDCKGTGIGKGGVARCGTCHGHGVVTKRYIHKR